MSVSQENPLQHHPKYEFVGFLGSGAYGTVVKARTRVPDSNGQKPEVAIKLLPRGRDNITKHVENELILHSKCCHPHVVSVKDVFLTPQSLAVVMELVPGGDLFSYVAASKIGLPEEKVRWIFQQLIVSVDYIHQMGIAQRDIKLENTLVVDSSIPWPRIKITDFGFCKGKENSACATVAGTCTYMAPEVIRSDKNTGYCGLKADMWSCGVMMYVMLFARYPFNVDDPSSPMVTFRKPTGTMCRALLARRSFVAQQVSHSGLNRKEVARLCKGDIQFPKGRHISPECQDILRRLICVDPAQRVTAADCQKHPWFTKRLPANAAVMNAECIKASRGRLSPESMDRIRNLVRLARGEPADKATALKGLDFGHLSINGAAAAPPKVVT